MCSLITFAIIFAILLTANAQSRCQNEPNGTQLPMPNSRTTYLICLSGAENIRNCPNGREFDPFDRRCLPVLINNANSGIRSLPAVRASDQCFNQKDGTYLPDVNSRNRFVLCNEGSSLTGECPPNQIFNQNTSTCEMEQRAPTRPTRASNPTRPPINFARTTTLRSAFSNVNARPTPRVTQQNSSYRPPSLQAQRVINPF